MEVSGVPEAATKHEQIIKYIESLKIGTKISVRKIAEQLDVSEGTAYRAIKEAIRSGLWLLRSGSEPYGLRRSCATSWIS